MSPGGSGLGRFVARRLVQAVPSVLLISVVSFLVLHLTPGVIVDVLAGEAGAATPEYVEMLRERFGLDAVLLRTMVRQQLAAARGGEIRPTQSPYG